ncbi:MAG: RdgB/HAM1 family non-canonical purine NTP pyrophosphatase [Bacteroidota bacterium]
MKVSKLLLATNNAKKVEEIRKIGPLGCELLTLEEVDFKEEIPETTNTIVGNSLQKAQYVFDRLGMDCLSDDSGLEINALNGKPGVDSAHYAGLPPNHLRNIDRVLRELNFQANREARFVTVLTLLLKGNVFQFEGEIKGTIAKTPLGNNGFGYDPIFIPLGYDQTFAQMDPEEKNKISHRALALQKLKDFLKSQE